MKKALLVVLSLFFLTVAGCGNPLTSEDSGKLKVVSSIYPVHDIVSNLGGYWVESDVLVAPGQSPHTYDPKPSDVAKLSEADVVFVVGAGMDGWIESMAESSGIDKAKIVDLSAYVTLKDFGAVEEGHEGDKDPHYWMSPKRVMEYTDDISAKLKEIDSGHSQDYDQYLAEYNQELQNLDTQIVEKVASFTSKDIVVFHDAFSYFADDYGINVVGVIEPTVGTEPTPQQLEQVVKNVEELGVKAVYKEPQLSSAVVDAIKNDLGIEMGILDPLGGVEGRLTYISLVKYNLFELARFLS